MAGQRESGSTPALRIGRRHQPPPGGTELLLVRQFEAGAGSEAHAWVERPIPGEERFVEAAIAVG